MTAFDSGKTSVNVIYDEPKSASSEFVARSWMFTIPKSWLLPRIVSYTLDVDLDKSQPTDLNDGDS